MKTPHVRYANGAPLFPGKKSMDFFFHRDERSFIITTVGVTKYWGMNPVNQGQGCSSPCSLSSFWGLWFNPMLGHLSFRHQVCVSLIRLDILFVPFYCWMMLAAQIHHSKAYSHHRCLLAAAIRLSQNLLLLAPLTVAMASSDFQYFSVQVLDSGEL